MVACILHTSTSIILQDTYRCIFDLCLDNDSIHRHADIALQMKYKSLLDKQECLDMPQNHEALLVQKKGARVS